MRRPSLNPADLIPTKGHRGIAALLLAYAAVLLFFRPATPFEWDEVLYQRALDHYDVAAHAPHPPGAPLFIWVADALRVVVRDPQLAIQGTAVLASLLCLYLVYRLALRLGATAGAALAAVVILAVVPGFCFHSNVGLSDVPSTAGVVAAALACVAAVDDVRRLPLAAAVTSLGLGVRPQVFPVLLPVGIAAVATAVRGRHWKPLGRAFLAGVATSAAVWLPALLLTGPRRYWEAVRWHAHYLATVESGLYFPRIPFHDVVHYWLVNPFGTGGIATVAGVLVVSGGVAWWATGRRRLVLVAGGSALVYLAIGACSMNALSAVRFALPAIPFLALLVAGNAVIRASWLRWPAALVGVAYLALAVDWGMPVYLLRREPAPVWASLTWIKQHLDPRRTKLVIDGGYVPHLQYVLKGTGFAYEVKDDDRIYASTVQPPSDVVMMLADPVPGCEVLFERTWHEPRVLQLAFQRYGSCALMRAPSGAGARATPNILVENRGWVVWARGRVALTDVDSPRITSLCPQTVPIVLRRPGLPPARITNQQCIDAAVFPGPAGAISLEAPHNVHALFRPLDFSSDAGRFAAAGLVAPELVLPLVARGASGPGVSWRSDVMVWNPQPRAVRVTGLLLRSGGDGGPRVVGSVAVAPGAKAQLDDVMGAGIPGGGADTAALAVVSAWSDGVPDATPGVVGFARVANLAAKGGGDRIGEGFPAVPAAAGVRVGGTADFDLSGRGRDSRTAVSVAAVARSAVTVRLSARDASGKLVSQANLTLPPDGEAQRWLDGIDAARDLTVEVTAGPEGASVYPCLTILDRASGRPVHLLPQQVHNPAGGFDAPAWRLALERGGRGAAVAREAAR